MKYMETGMNQNPEQIARDKIDNLYWVFGKQAGPLKYNDEQMQWLRMIKEYISTSFHIGTDDFNLSPFDSKGGFGKGPMRSSMK
jgi:hypothetical protein